MTKAGCELSLLTLKNSLKKDRTTLSSWNCYPTLKRANHPVNGRANQPISNSTKEQHCSKCQRPTQHRPNTVLFDEESHQFEIAPSAAAQCEIFVAIGTSAMVSSAFSLIGLANNAHKIEINTEETEVSGLFDENILGPAHIEVPKLM